ncbi:MAG: circularly permuted type 2 ATP-grasp protein [Verrucomicrobiota bacterium]
MNTSDHQPELFRRRSFPSLPGSSQGADSILKRLKRFSEKQLRLRFEATENVVRGLGMNEFSSAPESPQFHGEQMLSLDPIPLIIESEEWGYIRQGLQQRMQGFQKFFQDIYDQRKILREGFLPMHLVMDNPEFYRECVRLFSQEKSFFRWAACDLAKDHQGNWHVVRDHFSIPPMLSYALQNRRTQNQIFPELFEDRLVQSIGSFPLELLENLKALVSNPEEAQIVVLSNASTQSSEFDHSYLARKMGLPLVQPRDLAVRKAMLHYKTIHGLRPIHIALRCISSNHLDPLTFNGLDGTPGLIDCLRVGNLQVVNAPGTGIIGQRPLLKHADAIIRYYTREVPILPSLATHLCHDPDELENLLAKKEKYTFAHHLNIPLSDAKIQEALKSDSTSLVAHPRIEWQRLPVFQPETGETKALPFTLRCFASVSQNSFHLMPGGLTQVWKNDDFYNQSQFIAKDTWVIGSETRRASLSVPSTPKQARQLLGSRLAESLFWIGRYLERAEATARFLYILDEVHRDDPNRIQKSFPLWQALSLMTGHKADYLPRLYRKDHSKVFWYLTLDPKNTSSILYSIRQAKINASDLLDYIPPEAWTILNRLNQKLTDLSKEHTAESETSLFSIRKALDHVLNQTSAFNGMLFRTMTHDRGRDFLNLGTYLERSHLTLSSIFSLYSDKNVVRVDSNPEETDVENEFLALLMRGFCTLDNYRRQFQFRSLPLPVAEFLLKDKHVPVSLQFCFERLHSLFSRDHAVTLQSQTFHLIQRLDGMELADLFPIRPTPENEEPVGFLKELQEIRTKIENLSELVNDHFFVHQAETQLLFMNEESAQASDIVKES